MATSRTLHALPPEHTSTAATAAATADTVTAATTNEAADAATTAAATTASSDAGDDNSRSKLFDGVTFYLTQDLDHGRRRYLRKLIQDNGGVVLTTLAAGAIEIVMPATLRVGKPWVSDAFVVDSVRDQVLRNVHQYMAPNPSAVRTTSFLRPSSADTQPTGRKSGRMAYTVREDAALLEHVKTHAPHKRPMEDVALSVFEIAARTKLLDRSALSMHQRYRKYLKTLTPKERANVMQNASDERNAEVRRETAVREHARDVATAAEPSHEPPQQPADTPQQQQMAAAPASRSLTSDASRATATETASNSASAPPPPVTTSTSADSPTSTKSLSPSSAALSSNRVVSSAAADSTSATVPVLTDFVEATESVLTESVTAQDPEATTNRPDRSERNGVHFISCWASIIHDDRNLAQLQQLFYAARSTASASTTQAPARSDSETRRRKRSAPTAATTPASANPSHATTRKQQKRRHQSSATEQPPISSSASPTRASTTATAVAGSPTQPLDADAPDSVATEAETLQLIRQIRFATNHDVNAIVHALFYASGDVDTAVAFLEGASPRELWSHADDVLLEPFVRTGVTMRDVAAAERRGAFATMRVERTVAQIWTRIQYLL